MIPVFRFGPDSSQHRMPLKRIVICINIRHLCILKHLHKTRIDNYHPAFSLSTIFAPGNRVRQARRTPFDRHRNRQIPYLVQTSLSATIYGIKIPLSPRLGTTAGAKKNWHRPAAAAPILGLTSSLGMLPIAHPPGGLPSRPACPAAAGQPGHYTARFNRLTD